MNVQFSRKKISVGLVGVLVVVAVGVGITRSQATPKLQIVHKPATKTGIVAKIGGEEITEEALVGDDKMDFFELKKREYELRMDRVNKLLVEKLVGAEAKKAKMGLEDFINKKIIGGPIKITDKDFNKFVADKHIPESQLNPQIKEKINAYLETLKKKDLVDAYVAKLSRSTPVEVYFEKPKMSVQVDIGNAPFSGKESAKVKIVEFSDFQCPFCSRAADTVTQLKKKYGNKIQLAFRQFPLPMHPDARPTSEAALCMNEQSMDKFWKFHDLAFKNQGQLGKANLESYAKQAGADMKKFNECVASKKFADAVQKDIDYGTKLGVKSTPTFFINGQIVNGAVPIESFSEIVDEELADAK